MTTPVDPAELAAAVRVLDEHVEEMAARTADVAAEARSLDVSRRKHRAWIILTMLGLTACLILGAVAWHQSSILQCTQRNLAQRQDYNERNFQAEFAKVSGQIEGINQLEHYPAPGIAQFRAASQHYLDTIAAIHRDQVAHPAGEC